ncbi:MAG: SDR family oxidoreductase [Alphaproteobacteria bacterium]|nr:SDR family oxidoreductase [Alphaproteobacteria bacterium]
MPHVVVTGASTGIGRATAVLLAARGFDVFAGVRSEADAAAVDALHDRITPVRVDVTDGPQIAALAEQVDATTGDAGLAGLVNNAGIAVGGPMETIDLAQLRWQLEVNVVGQVAVAQALMPALRRATGRIVNVGSTGSRITAPWLGPYTASKHALAAVTNAQRQELAPWGMHAILVEPGAIATPIWDKGREEAKAQRADPDPRVTALYPHVVDTMARIVDQQQARGIPPERVAEVIHTALTVRRPKTRYPVGFDATVTTWIGSHLPDRWLDGIIRRLR